ncbi:NAD(P)-dependent oxidoreductase [Paenibacillus tritici]|uniref:NAD-dependent epimerase/dehydratase family protein n=1 Tax=Paenibacillus tritici TaxID=1873425 RepID=UPI001BA6AC0E|nr:NAD(P)-dependent oxidoreductase [Paenibacillus tritici]QUL54475.1 NAD(P)-dependent oxidoreductase [Paenibacillus tritici]
MLNKDCLKIAILGATGHIAKSLVVGLSSFKHYELFLFARTQERLVSFLFENNINDKTHIRDYKQFQDLDTYNVIINCIGVGNPEDLLRNPFSVFQITEQYDNMILQYIQKNPDTIYINLSSGAAYGSDFEQPATNTKLLNLNINNLSLKDYYGISKLNMEAKHRSLESFKIVDLRIFGFFSAFIDMKSKFLLTEVIEHVWMRKVLNTSSENILRDYVHPEDFLSLVQSCMDENIHNGVYDVYSLKPATKFDILDYFAREHGLKYEVDTRYTYDSITGSKTNYYSLNSDASTIGYLPSYTSIESIESGYQQLRMRNKNENN